VGRPHPPIETFLTHLGIWVVAAHNPPVAG